LEQEKSARIRLLEDIRAIFTQRGVRRLTTAKLVRDLTQLPESPWSDWKGKGLNAHTLGRLLGEWEIDSDAWRTKNGTRRGYRLDQFQDLFERYLSSPPSTSKRKRNKRNGG
jgi:putative DNA primase/helicase